MNQLRDILNAFKWKDTSKFSDLEIWYIHRGAAHDTHFIKGSEVIAIHRTFIETIDAMIPHHRIFRITYRGTLVFDRQKSLGNPP